MQFKGIYQEGGKLYNYSIITKIMINVLLGLGG